MNIDGMKLYKLENQAAPTSLARASPEVLPDAATAIRNMGRDFFIS